MHRTLLIFATLAACNPEEMTRIEALEALGQAHKSSRGDQATGDVIEVETDFTIGGAAQAAAEEIRDFWESQAPCTEVTVAGNVLTVDYGTLDDACTFRGRTYAGVNTTTFVATAGPNLEVEHDWGQFTDGSVTVDGLTWVTWSGSDVTRTVRTEHTLDVEGEVLDVTGEHVTAPLSGGLFTGFTLDGDRQWSGDAGDWSLTMEGLELRWIDPAPQAGSTVITAPTGKELTVRYARVDELTIEAVVDGILGGQRVYHIKPLGQIEER